MTSLVKERIRKWNWQSILVSLCILAVCVGTQQMQTVKWDTGLYEFSRDALGVLMAIIIFTNYKWSHFVKYKIPYIVWSVLGIALGAILIPMAIARRSDFLMADTIIIALGIFLMGYCIIHTIISFFVEKQRPQFFLPLFIMWVVMLVLMIFSKSEFIWPECYFVLFLCYYLTEQTPVQRANVTKGIVNGLILAYVLIQAHALLFRPYDRVRYIGNFCNPNHNCLFLCFCLAAILAKLLFVTKENQKTIVKVFYFLLAGTCYSFIFMTMCRSGYLATFVMTIFFLLAYCKIREKRIFFKTGLLLVSMFIVVMPLTYAAVRYIPTIHPHVLFYFQEGYSEDRVHSWDPRDSEKFISFQEMLDASLGRFSVLHKELSNDEVAEVMSPVEDELSKNAVLTREDGSNAFLVRYTIYKWYFTHLSLRGMPYDEQGFQLTPTHWIQDTHNIYLDYGINFGYPVMILFTILIWWGIARLVKQGLKNAHVEKLSSLLLAMIPPVFGMLEFAWGAGMVATMVLYLMFKEMFYN